ncbi:unnamed protein product, partial [Polarella glacialis]
MSRKQPYERIDRDVARRYDVLGRIGRGCYGVVFEVQAKDVALDYQRYAMKKILYAYTNSSDAQKTYREISYLMEFGHHENIVQVHDVLCSADDRHVYIVMQLADSDLRRAIKNRCLREIHRPLIA